MSTNYSHIEPFDCVGDETVCPVEASIYGYAPDLPSTIFFLVLFAACGIVNVYFGIRYKTWTYMIALAFGCFTMALGYIGRILMSKNPFDLIGFQIQICCLTLAPAFNSAAIYLILKHLVRTFGRDFSRLRPKYYTWIFISADIGALVLQGAGGGIASTADDDHDMMEVGDGLMLAGVSWQVATLVTFAAAALDFAARRYRGLATSPLSLTAQTTKQDPKFKIFMAAYLLAFVTILIRCIYRIAEMASGWRSSLMKNQTLFIVLESVMLSIATLCQTIFHPGFCFPAIAATSMKLGKDLDSSDETLAASGVVSPEPKPAEA